MSRSLKLIAALLFASLAVTACGKRGPLEAPGVVDDEGSKPAKSATHDKGDEPHRDFILDGLLR